MYNWCNFTNLKEKGRNKDLNKNNEWIVIFFSRFFVFTLRVSRGNRWTAWQMNNE